MNKKELLVELAVQGIHNLQVPSMLISYWRRLSVAYILIFLLK